MGALPGKAQNTPFDGRALEGTVHGHLEVGAAGLRWGEQFDPQTFPLSATNLFAVHDSGRLRSGIGLGPASGYIPDWRVS